ncbi:hypothetical protein DL93DRAFT_2158947 [Clavulina sp. PMI_390]|nr:hypothetical protein DL93DRAFT_2158947 [Clavulina sp. PMI_390]
MPLPLPASDDDDGTLDTLWKEAIHEFEESSGKALNDPTLSGIFGNDLTSESIDNALVKCGVDLKKFRNRGSFVLNILKPFLDTFKAVIDPVGDIVANAGVPGGAVIFAAVGRLLKAIQGVSKHYDDLAEALIQIHGMLARVKFLCNADAIEPALRKLCIETLSHVLVIVSHFVKYCAAARFNRASKVLGARIGDLLNQVAGRDKAQVALAELGRLIRESDQFIIAQTFAVTTQTHNLQRLQLIVERIAPPNASQNQDERLEQGKVIPGHAKWLISSERFNKWFESSNNFFWVSANAGVGKSVLWVPDKRLYNKFLASIIAHFSDTSSECEKVLLSAFSRARIPTDVSRSKLEAVVESMLATRVSKLLVVDALDECMEEGNNRKLLLSYLSDLFKKLVPQSGNLRIFATSRPLRDIERALWHAHNKVVTHRLQLGEEQDHMTTLRAFINTKLNGEEFEGSDWSPSFKEGVASTLIDKSESMFLWAQLQIKQLAGYTQTEASRMLLDLPTDVAATYARILREVDPRRRETIRAVFECIIAANLQGQPLTSAEIQEILRFNLQSTQQKPKCLYVGFNYREDESHPGSLKSKVDFDVFKYLPSALIKLDDDGGVQFIHFTVQEYLLSEPEFNEGLHRHFATSLQNARSTYFLVSMSALDRVNSHSVPILMRYANESWYNHAKLALADDIPILNALEHFLDPNSPSFSDWVERRYEDLDLSDYRDVDTAHSHRDHPIHWAIRIGSLAQVRRLCQFDPEKRTEPPLNICNAYDSLNWTPLCWAAVCGHAEIFKFLLEANTTWPHQHVGPFHDQFRRQRETATVLNILLCTNIRPLHIPGVAPSEDTPFAWPLRNLYSLSDLRSQSATMVQALLDSVTDTTATNLLSAHDLSGYTPLLRVLLGWRLDGEKQNWMLNLIRVLLSKGANPHVQANNGKGIAHIACINNSWIIPALMADITIDVNLSDKNGNTPLHDAVQMNLGDVEILLNAGADPNKCNSKGDQPLDIVVEEIARHQNATLGYSRWLALRWENGKRAVLEEHGARLHSQVRKRS